MEYCNKFNKKIKGFSKNQPKFYLHYRYPGNVRELSNIVEYAVNFCDRDLIGSAHLPAYLTEQDILRPVTESSHAAQERTAPLEYSSAQSWDDAENK